MAGDGPTRRLAAEAIGTAVSLAAMVGSGTWGGSMAGDSVCPVLLGDVTRKR